MGNGRRARAQRDAAAAAREAFEPPIRAGLDPPVDVVNARLAAQAEEKRLQAILEPRIDGHLLMYQHALQALTDAHRGIGDSMEFGMGGRTRWTAVWELAGRCIGLSNAMLVQIRAGFTSEAVPTMRSIHETGQLLTVIAGPGEEQLLRRWLDSKDIGVQTARSAEHRIEKPFVQEMARRGIRLQDDQHKLSQEIYDLLSAPAHAVREGFIESVSVRLRQFAYGLHPDCRQRALHTEFAGQQIEEVVQRIGGAFSTRFLGAGFYRDTIEPLMTEINVVRAAMPVDAPTVSAL